MLPSTVSTMHTRVRRGLALVAVPVALVVAGCSSAPATTAPAAAADAYTVAGTVLDAPLDRLKIQVGVTTTGENAVTIPPEAIEVVVDTKAGKGSLHLALPVAALGDQAASLGALGVTGDTLELDAVFDGQGLYVKSPIASKVLPLLMLQSGQVPAGDLSGWLKLGTAQEFEGLLGGLNAMPSGSAGPVDELKNLDPAQLKQKLEEAGVVVTYVGPEQRNGVDAEHLTLTLDPAKLAASDIAKQLPAGQLGQIAGAAGVGDADRRRVARQGDRPARRDRRPRDRRLGQDRHHDPRERSRRRLADGAGAVHGGPDRPARAVADADGRPALRGSDPPGSRRDARSEDAPVTATRRVFHVRRGPSARDDPPLGIDRRPPSQVAQLGARDLVARVVARPDQRPRLDVLEAERERLVLHLGELVGVVVALERQVLGVGRRYWPIVRMSRSTSRSASNASVSSSRVSPRPTISELFVWTS